MAPIARHNDRIISRAEIESLIADGRRVVIVEGGVLKVDAWLPYHPGGDKAILHMVGRDATNEVRAFHSQQTQHFMRKYQVGRIEGLWADFVPPIRGGKFRTRDEIEAAARKQKIDDDERYRDLSSTEDSSEEPSPIFEGQEHRTSTFRRRRPGSDEVGSVSSASSLDTLDLDKPAIVDPQTLPNDTELDDLSMFPSLDPATQTEIIAKYRELDARITASGMYKCNYTAYAVEGARYLTLATMCYLGLRSEHYSISAVFLGLLWHQLVFTVHDAGHMGITHNFHVDTTIGILIANFLGGLSVCWWKRNHNVHHIVTNSPAHDPDIQHMPFFAVSPKFFNSLFSSYYDRFMPYDAFSKFTLKWQHWMYYPLLTFGRFNLYRLSWEYIILGLGPRKGPAWWHRYLELVGQIIFWTWFGYFLLYRSLPDTQTRILYLLISHAITMPVHVQITLSHFAMSTTDLGVAESFPQRMLRTTMDVDCPAWLDFIHGGLQFQAVHHLFPRVPRHNLRACQDMVKNYCEDVGIPYAIYGFVEGNGKVIGRLGEVARLARVMGECQKAAAKDLVEGH